ncbi:MAG TPA: 3-isopropylmalate dehydratase small subunit [bacterium]|nr:3-isopropylmalate dehydratase small subunit [bacterium]
MSTQESHTVIRGRAWSFGDDISTDLLSPGVYAVAPLEERRRHTLEPVNPHFAAGVRPGDIVIAGRNFGCGSSRETAPEELKALGVGCVVAASFARIFLRNAVAIGLPALPCPGAASAVDEGDLVEVDLDAGALRNLRTGIVVTGAPLPPQMVEILRAGGILALLAHRTRERIFRTAQ